MSSQNTNNLKLGAFVLGGLVVLILSMYLIGKNQNLFGSNFTLKARFKTVSGLTAGNNVRFSGINAGTVKTIKILSDTSIEVIMILNKKLESFITKSSVAEIGNEGLMGNKVINLAPGIIPAAPVEDGDMLQSKAEVNTGNMLETFSRTNDNVEVISNDLKFALKRLNSSKPLWEILEDTTMSKDITTTLRNFRKSSESFNSSASDLKEMIQNVKKGEGVAGMLMTDKKEAENLKNTLDHLNKVSANADKLTARLDSLAAEMQKDMKEGKGTIPMLMKDPDAANKIQKSLSNIADGSATFKDEMESLKQNKFIKRYMGKEAKKAAESKK